MLGRHRTGGVSILCLLNAGLGVLCLCGGLGSGMIFSFGKCAVILGLSQPHAVKGVTRAGFRFARTMHRIRSVKLGGPTCSSVLTVALLLFSLPLLFVGFPKEERCNRGGGFIDCAGAAISKNELFFDGAFSGKCVTIPKPTEACRLWLFGVFLLKAPILLYVII